jgi:hypothetical protein
MKLSLMVHWEIGNVDQFHLNSNRVPHHMRPNLSPYQKYKKPNLKKKLSDLLN